MKRQPYFLDTYPLNAVSDESDDYTDPGLDAPKRSPMRRKGRFRAKDYTAERKHKERSRKYRSSIRYDFE